MITMAASVADPYHFPGSGISSPGVLGSESISYLMITTKLSGQENLTKYALWLGPFGPSDKENQVKMYKSTDLGTLSL